MYLASFLNNLIKEDGFVLINANSTKYIIGRPKKENPITIKLLDKKLHYKLLLYPDLYLGEAYTEGLITFKNGDLSAFLESPWYEPNGKSITTNDIFAALTTEDAW